MALEVTLSTSSFFPDSELTFRAAAELGYDGVEVMVNHDRRTQSVGSIEEMASKYDVKVHSIHVPCLAVTQHVWGFNPELKLRRTVDMAEALGATAVVVHPPFRWQKQFGAQFVNVVRELNASPHVTVAVENMYRVESLGRIVNPYLCNDDPGFSDFDAVTLDTSHAAANKWDPIDLFQEMGDRVKHVHLSDSTTTRGDEHLPPGMGTLPLEKLAATMTDNGFDGQVVLEVALQRLPPSARMAAALECKEWAVAAFRSPRR